RDRAYLQSPIRVGLPAWRRREAGYLLPAALQLRAVHVVQREVRVAFQEIVLVAVYVRAHGHTVVGLNGPEPDREVVDAVADLLVQPIRLLGIGGRARLE